MNIPTPTVHKTPFFVKNYKLKDKTHKMFADRLERFLKAGAPAGQKKAGGLNPLYGFPTGKKSSLRITYLFCRDCQKNLFTSQCSFCESGSHSMNDAVLFDIDSNHDKAYTRSEKNLKNIKNGEWKPPY